VVTLALQDIADLANLVSVVIQDSVNLECQDIQALANLVLAAIAEDQDFRDILVLANQELQDIQVLVSLV